MHVNQKIRIALSLPGLEHEHNYFTFLLKSDLSRERSNYSQPSKLFAISDINIDFYLLCRILIKTGVMDRHYQWTFGDAHLLVWADQIRNEDLIKCFWLIYSLEDSAKRKGGYVHVILGNKNILNPIYNKWRLQQPQYAKGISRNTFLYDGNSELWRWLNTKNFIEKIGNNIYTQLENSYKYFESCTSIEIINHAMHSQRFFESEIHSDELCQDVVVSTNVLNKVLTLDTPVMYGVNNIITRIKNDLGEFFLEVYQTSYSIDGPWKHVSKFFMLKHGKFYLTNEIVKGQHVTHK
jgi:hypothetical protein